MHELYKEILFAVVVVVVFTMASFVFYTCFPSVRELAANILNYPDYIKRTTYALEGINKKMGVLQSEYATNSVQLGAIKARITDIASETTVIALVTKDSKKTLGTLKKGDKTIAEQTTAISKNIEVLKIKIDDGKNYLADKIVTIGKNINSMNESQKSLFNDLIIKYNELKVDISTIKSNDIEAYTRIINRLNELVLYMIRIEDKLDIKPYKKTILLAGCSGKPPHHEEEYNHIHEIMNLKGLNLLKIPEKAVSYRLENRKINDKWAVEITIDKELTKDEKDKLSALLSYGPEQTNGVRPECIMFDK